MKRYILLALLLLVGCSSTGETLLPSNHPTRQQDSSAQSGTQSVGNPLESSPASTDQIDISMPNLEQVKLGQDMEQTRKTLGAPDRVRRSGESLEYWSYDSWGLSVRFLEGVVAGVRQTKGQLSTGLKIGDPEDKLANVGVVIEESPAEGYKWIMLADDGEGILFAVVEHGKVTELIYEYPEDTD